MDIRRQYRITSIIITVISSSNNHRRSSDEGRRSLEPTVNQPLLPLPFIPFTRLLLVLYVLLIRIIILAPFGMLLLLVISHVISRRRDLAHPEPLPVDLGHAPIHHDRHWTPALEQSSPRLKKPSPPCPSALIFQDWRHGFRRRRNWRWSALSWRKWVWSWCDVAIVAVFEYGQGVWDVNVRDADAYLTDDDDDDFAEGDQSTDSGVGWSVRKWQFDDDERFWSK